jgi:hypothetical protein
MASINIRTLLKFMDIILKARNWVNTCLILINLVLRANAIGHFPLTDEETDDGIQCDCGSLGNSPRNVCPSHAFLLANKQKLQANAIILICRKHKPRFALSANRSEGERESSAERLKSREDDTHRDQLNPF